MRFISQQVGVEYLEIPKVACSSIKAALLIADGIKFHGDGMHNNKLWQRTHITLPSKSFTFVRHPCDRLESTWREKCRTGKAKIIDPSCDVPTTASFAEWVDWVTAQDPRKCNKHWQPQSLILEHYQTQPDFIGRFETLINDWERLRESHSGLPELPHINSSDNHDPIDWDGITLDKAAQFYAEDLNRWGYTLDNYLRLPRLDDWKDIEGFMDPLEGAELQRLARNRNVLEIGVWKARSTIAMVATAKHIVAVDHFHGDDFAGHANTGTVAWTNLCETKARDRVTLIIGDISHIRDLLDGREFGLIHYDADHTFEATASFLQSIQLEGCPIAVHDYDQNPNHAGVRKAVDEFVMATGRTIQIIKRLAILDYNAHQ